MTINNLGNWALIDLETTGADAQYDSIIDVAYLQFDGIKLVRQYQTLVKAPMDNTRNPQISQFIQKLTGITPAHLKHAPNWDAISPELGDLADHHLIAHNSEFERSFLDPLWRDILPGVPPGVQYQDSILYLALLHPGRSSLNLESFIVDYKLAEKEEHRALSDCLDLLKVLLMATLQLKLSSKRQQELKQFIQRHHLQSWWWAGFSELSHKELLQLAKEINFDLDAAQTKWLAESKVRQGLNQLPPANYPFDSETVKHILQNEVLLKTVLPDYRQRDGQIELALKTGQSFKNGIHAMIQAPTGTGKTLGYLLPAALFSIQEKQQVLIATGTKALQQQAVSKDIPQLRAILGSERPRVERLVGSSNHWCELLYRESNQEGDLLNQARSFEEKYSRLYLDLVFAENATRDARDSLLRDQLPYVLKKNYEELERLDRSSAVDFRACTGHKCPFKNECSYIKGLRAAKDADIILGNHALMFTWPRGIPRPQYIVVDEAHKIEHEATNAYSLEITQRLLEEMIKNLLQVQGIGPLFYLLSRSETQSGESTPIISTLRQASIDAAQMAQDHLNELPDKVELFFKKRPRYSEQYWNECSMPKLNQGNDPNLTRIIHHLEGLRHIIGHLYDTLLPYLSRWELAQLEDDAMVIALTRFESFMASLEDMTAALKKGLEMDEADPSKHLWCRTLRFHQQEGFSLSTYPIDVGRLLHDQLLVPSNSVVFTSATLGNQTQVVEHSTKGVEWSTGHLYLQPSKRFKAPMFIPATFDYEHKTRISLCDDVPALYERHFVPYVIEKIAPLIERLQGRSLLLFSARARFEEARELLLERFSDQLPLFIQGMGTTVVEDFKRSGRGILLGMETFGEGIDVPGEALQFIFVDKIPDLRMDLVIQERREFFERTFGNEFSDYYLSGRVRSLHQKLGRLLRTENDIGAAIVVDARLKKWHGKTMGTVNRLLKPYTPHRCSLDKAIEDTLNFLRPEMKTEQEINNFTLQ